MPFPREPALLVYFQIDCYTCLLCGLEESTSHLFFYCPLAARLWMVSQWSLNSLARLGLSCFEWCEELWRIEDSMLDKNLLIGFAGCLMDVVWKAHNVSTHGAPIPSFTELLTRLFFFPFLLA